VRVFGTDTEVEEVEVLEVVVEELVVNIEELVVVVEELDVVVLDDVVDEEDE